MSKNAQRFKESHSNKPQKQFHDDRFENNIVEIDFKQAASKPIETLSESQKTHKSSLFCGDPLVIGLGAAGVGKTYLSAAVAAELYLQKAVKNIILTRPNIEVGKSLGFLPGSLEEKYAPYLEPFQKALVDRMGSNKFKADFMKRILPKPIGFMRGATFDDAVILLDEAQNTTINEMRMIITRPGQNCRLFITGDVTQTDLKGDDNGLAWLVKNIKRFQKSYDIIEYRDSESVRSAFVLDMLDLIRKAD